MQRNLPPLNALRAFEAAARLTSFSKAGEELNVSHSSISRHVRGLEARIGVQLFENLPRGVGLTNAGAIYLKDVSHALDLISDATEQLAPRHHKIVRLSCEPTFATKWLMPALGSFSQQHSEIKLKIDPSYELVDLHRGTFDLAIRFSNAPMIDLEADIVSHVPVFPVGSPDLLSDDVDLDNPESLLSLPFLGEYPIERWSDWFEKAGLPLSSLTRPQGEFKATLTIEAAVAGQGIALLSRDLISHDLQAGRLVRFSNTELDYGAYRLVYEKKALRSPSVRKFRDWLLEATEEFRSLTLQGDG